MGNALKFRHNFRPFFKGAKFYDVYGREYEITSRNQYFISIWNKPECYDNYEYIFTNTEDGKTHHCTQIDLENKIASKKITFNDKFKSKLDELVEEQPEEKTKYWFVETNYRIGTSKNIKAFYYIDKQFNLKKALDYIQEKNENVLLTITEIDTYEEFKKHQKATKEWTEKLTK